MGLGDGFYRIKRLPPYVFAQVQSLKLEARQQGEDIIDFGMGNPDQPTPSHIVEKMIEAAQEGEKSSLLGLAWDYETAACDRGLVQAELRCRSGS